MMPRGSRNKMTILQPRSARVQMKTESRSKTKGKCALRKWLPEKVVWAIRYKYLVELPPNTTSAQQETLHESLKTGNIN
jgi:hypothetical protein